MIRYSLKALAIEEAARIGRRKPRGRVTLKPITPSHGAEARLRKAIRAALAQANAYVRTEIMPAYATERRLTQDAALQDNAADRMAQLLQAFKELLRRLFASVQVTAQQVQRAEALRHTEKFAEAARAALSVDVRAILAREDLDVVLSAAAARNAALIDSLSEDVHSRIASAVMTAVVEGQPASQLSADIARRFGIVGRRADLIARDQLAKLTTDLNRLRQQQAGVASYIWSTSKDERVRLTHRANEGRTFRWSDPPKSTGHPGHDVNCRCVPIPVVAFD